MHSDSATRSVIDHVSQIDRTRRELFVQERELAGRVDTLRNDSVLKAAQLRQLQSREAALRARIDPLAGSLAAAKRYAADAAATTDRARAHEPVLLKLSHEDRDAAAGERDKWARCLDSVDGLAAAWSVPATAAAAAAHQQELARLDAQRQALNADEAAARARLADVAQRSLDARRGVLAAKRALAAAVSAAAAAPPSSATDATAALDGATPAAGGDSGATAAAHLRRAIDDAAAAHQRAVAAPEREVAMLAARIVELEGWVAASAASTDQLTRATAAIQRRKQHGLCGECGDAAAGARA
jgi:hypothetical protein